MGRELFDETARALLERTRDAHLVGQIQKYLAGGSSRFDLMRDAGFSEAMQQWYDEVADEHRQRGIDLAEVGAQVWKRWEDESISRS